MRKWITRVPHISLPALIVYKKPYLFLLLRVNYSTKIVAPILACWILIRRSPKGLEKSHSLWLNDILATSSGRSTSTLWTRNFNLSDPRVIRTWYEQVSHWPLGEGVSISIPASFSLFLNQCIFFFHWAQFYIQVSDLMHRLHCEGCHTTLSDNCIPSWHINCTFRSPFQYSLKPDASEWYGMR